MRCVPRLGAAGLFAVLAGLAGCAALEGPDRGGIGTPSQSAFSSYLESLWPDAKARGVSRKTFDMAFAGLTEDPSVVALTKRQSEFVQPIWSYVSSAASASRVAKGEQMARQWSATLDRIERTYGVPRSVLLGIWGMETGFGANTGGKDVIRSLATLAMERYRGDFFRGELLVALQILEKDHIRRADMTGSWAGAMGQTQFMPSSFMQYAVDFDGDGRRDIWTNVPEALASTANYLRQKGWQPGLPWGVEVKVPAGADLAQGRRSFAAWSAAGMRRADGGAMPAQGEASIFFPAGAHGPAFLLTDNFLAIKAYNSSDAYALGVAHLGDRAVGGRALVAGWPTHLPQLSKEQTQEVQHRLNALGYDNGEPDGRIGTKTREAVKTYQAHHRLMPDGYPTPDLLARLRVASR